MITPLRALPTRLGAALLLASGLLTASAPAPLPTVLSGHLDHAPRADWVRFQYGPQGMYRAAAVLSPAGNFRFVFTKLKAPAQVAISCADQYTLLWLSPGDHQHLTADFAKLIETAHYSGRGAAASNYLARAFYRFDNDAPGQLAPPLYKLTLQTTPAAFLQQEAAYHQQRRAFLTRYARAHPLPAAFAREQRLVLELEQVRDLLNFPGFWTQAHRNDTPPPALALPATYFDFLRQVPLRQLAAHATGATKKALEDVQYAYSNRLLPSGHLSTDPAEAGRLYALAAAELGPTPARDQVMYQLLSEQLINNYPGVLAAYPTFRAQNRDSALAGRLRQKLAARRQLDPGQPAPDFTLRDNTGKEVSLRDLRGKVVYLDFWGTWCPPCMKELTKYSHALAAHFLGQEVAFVYISVSDVETQWQHVLRAEQLSSANSVHLRAADAAVTKSYQVFSFPSYYLIGRDGRFIQAYTTRPSDGAKTLAAIEAALAAAPTANAQP